LRSGEVIVTGAASVKVSASTVKVTAGMLDVTAAMSRFSGVVRCDSLVTNSVVSASYTPGAGNVW
jgi:TATA-box binding protein (TBP) (component of TFIID and TFIIIB)